MRSDSTHNPRSTQTVTSSPASPKASNAETLQPEVSGKALAVRRVSILATIAGLLALPWVLSTWICHYFATHYSPIVEFYTYDPDLHLSVKGLDLGLVVAWVPLLFSYVISYKKRTVFPGLLGLGVFIFINNSTAIVQALTGLTHPL